MTAVESNKSAKTTTSAPTTASVAEAAEEKDKENDDQNRADDAKTSDLFCCFDCKSSLAKSQHIINIAGQSRRWHPECFKCTICREPMDKKQSCHVYKDQIVCRTDYTRLRRANAVRCARCRRPISASDWVRKASKYVYHIACFNCDICLRQLNTGEQFIINDHAWRPISNDERDTDAGDMRLLCRLHFTVDPTSNQVRESNESRSQLQSNTKVGQKLGRNLSAPNESPLDQEGRESSSTSPPTSSKQPVDNTNAPTLELNDYQLLHQHQEERNAYLNHQKHQHHHLQSMATVSSTSRLAAPNSASSSFLSPLIEPATTTQQLLPNRQMDESEMSTRITAAGKQDDHHLSLSTTTTSAHDSLLSEQHHQRRVTTTTTASVSLSTSSSASSTPSSILNTTTYLGPMTPTNNAGGGGGQQASSGLSCKSKRVRTTFTEDQLSILQTHFQIDSNPDGQDLERIATITGLSKRVTQVWFQNSRARQKKYMIKRKPLGGTASLAAGFSMATVTSTAMSQLTSERTFHSASSPIGLTAATTTLSSETLKANNYHQMRFHMPAYSFREGSFDSDNRDQQQHQQLQRPGSSTEYGSGSSNKGDTRAAWAESGPSIGPTEAADSGVVDDENENYDGSQSSDEYHMMVSDDDSLEAGTA